MCQSDKCAKEKNVWKCIGSTMFRQIVAAIEWLFVGPSGRRNAREMILRTDPWEVYVRILQQSDPTRSCHVFHFGSSDGRRKESGG